MALSNNEIINMLIYENKEFLNSLCDGYVRVSDTDFESTLQTIIQDNLRTSKQLKQIRSRN